MNYAQCVSNYTLHCEYLASHSNLLPFIHDDLHGHCCVILNTQLMKHQVNLGLYAPS